jgi:P27 family predicted phage terminase small subunit
MSKENQPQPPEHLEGEALLEWERICDELDQIGKLAKTDRAIIKLYCETWAVNNAVAQHVTKFGAVVKWSNGVPGQGPWYKTMKETTAQLSKLLDQLGLTPANRATKETEQTEDIEF